MTKAVEEELHEQISRQRQWEAMVYTIQNSCSEANKYPEYIYLTLNKYDIFDLKA